MPKDYIEFIIKKVNSANTKGVYLRNLNTFVKELRIIINQYENNFEPTEDEIIRHRDNLRELLYKMQAEFENLYRNDRF